MRDQTVVVTGGNRGLGLELSRQLQSLGAEVIATARDPRAAIDLRALEVRIEPLDVSDAESIESFANRLAHVDIDILINNAGIGGSGNGVGSLDFSELERFFLVNSLGPLRVTRALLSNLRRGKGRRIVHVTSKMGSLTENIEGGYYGYRTSKAALNMVHRCLAAELAGQGFVCVALHPGWVRTGMGGNHAPLSPRESVRGLLGVIARLQREYNGRFLDYTGAEIPW
jgi:NAD(P)-dependent dehydrogenase (short-subunit alcohol dehydrogenase family)